MYINSVAMDVMVHEYLVPAMKRGSLKILAVMLAENPSVESIFRVLPQSKVEELAIAIAMDNYFYSKAVRPQWSVHIYTIL